MHPTEPADIKAFQHAVWGYYDAHGRHDLPWRAPEVDGSFDPYKILVSEMMLQQTQVGRVIPKFKAFIEKYPTVNALAKSPLGSVITLWSGLGYNRRAKFLWQAAQTIQRKHQGSIPRTKSELVSLPGIGANTAGAILTYAYNVAEPFVETNVRTVFFHHFFDDQTKIPDSSLLPLVAETLPKDRARVWYWALMDYGANLKQTVGNLSRSSSHYVRQSAFHGSRRQIRGYILRLLTEIPHSLQQLEEKIADERLTGVLEDLTSEGFIEENGSLYRLRS